MKEKKLLALLLVLCMVLSLLPTVAFAEGETTVTYIKITKADDLTSGGEYLIVYEGGKVAFNGALNTLDATNNTVAVEIDSESNTIAASDSINAATFTITSVGEEGYSIQSKSGLYIARTANSNGLNQATAYDDNYKNTITFDDSGSANITSTEYNKVLKFNNASNQNRFRYYGSGQQSIYLYKKVVSGGTDEPEPTTYTVTYNAGEGSGSMPADAPTATTGSLMLPECGFTAPEGKRFAGWLVNIDNEVHAAGSTITGIAGDVILTAQWEPIPSGTKTYTLVTDESELAEDDTVIIVGVNEDAGAFALGTQNSNNRAAYGVTINANAITLDAERIAQTNEAKVYELTIGEVDGGWVFYDPIGGGYLYAASKSSNYLRTESTLDDNGKFKLTFGENGAITAVAQGANTHNYFRFNASNELFSCYASSSSIDSPIYLYKLNENPGDPSFEKQALALSGRIGVVFNMYLPATDGINYYDSYMKFTGFKGDNSNPDQVAFNPNNMNPSKTLYSFTCYINSLQMAEPITATFYYKQNGEEKHIDTTYAAQDYFTAFDKAVDDGVYNETDDKELIDLVHSVADYGYHAQLFLANTHGWSNLSDKYVPMTKVYTKSYAETATAIAAELNSDDYKISVNGGDSPAYKLSLDSETAITVYVKAQGAITVNGENYDGEPATDSQGRRVIVIGNLGAHKLSKVNTIVVGDSYTVELSALTYMQALLNSTAYGANTTDTTRAGLSQNMAYAFYNYADAANKFKAAHPDA